MIDINIIRTDPGRVRENIKKKFKDEKLVLLDEIIKKDKLWRSLKLKADTLRADRNRISKEISQVKKEKKPINTLLKKAKSIPGEIEETEAKVRKLHKDISATLQKMPNFMHKSVPKGKDEKANKVTKMIGKPKKITHKIINHAELGEQHGLFDFDSSAETSGNGFYYMEGDIALLNQALIRFGIDTMIKHGYTYVETPLMLRGKIIDSVTDLADKEAQIYKIQDEDLYLIGTSEHSLIGRYIDKIIPAKKLPIKNTAYSMCFRKEIGSHGIDQKGLFRTHQFNKIEMVVICDPKDSMKHFEEMQKITIDIFKQLGIPTRVLQICSGDLGDLKHIQVDIEAWSPRKKGYYEVGSCSNLTDAQARKLKIRAEHRGEKFVPHTLNNTAIATSRALVAILENYQQPDGSIKIPSVLQKYMGGKKVIGKKK